MTATDVTTAGKGGRVAQVSDCKRQHRVHLARSTALTAGIACIAGHELLGRRHGLLVLRGTLGYGSVTSYFVACHWLPLADAMTFTFLAPLVAAVFSPLVLRERPSMATLCVIPVCLCGVLLITQPSFVFGAQAAPALSGIGLLFGLLQPTFSASSKVRVEQCLIA